MTVLARIGLLAALSAALAAPLAGCGIFRSDADIAMQKTPAFQNGYNDGCASANAEDTNMRGDAVRDDAAYANDKVYRNGWQSGFSACRSNFSQTPNAGSASLPNATPGH